MIRTRPIPKSRAASRAEIARELALILSIRWCITARHRRSGRAMAGPSPQGHQTHSSSQARVGKSL
jgi:hypothetical protein